MIRTNTGVTCCTAAVALASIGAMTCLAVLSGCERRPENRAAPGVQARPLLLALDGSVVESLPLDRDQMSVFIFVSVDCPISNRYMPELRRLHEKFSPQGAVFRFVYPDPAATSDAIVRHGKEYQSPFESLRDPEHGLVRLTGAQVTPEAAVFIGTNLVYRGRIDNRFADFGKDRMEPTQRDLEEVLQAVVDGRPVTASFTRAVGCYIAGRP